MGTVEYKSPNWRKTGTGDQHFQEVSVPEPEADLQLARERLTGLNASLWAIDHHVELAQIASTSEDTADLEAQLQQRFGFTPDECSWITSQPVIRLTRSCRATIESQVNETKKYLVGDF
ncbi:hypothetical protein H351_32200 (plasmid) [Rhodococcus erythropolis R138]|uniref:hypothetical protein n=1 Tax=Rhodococcus erythropolis TaxID=1833 RepID=UPI0004A8748D|nr:hypothetical protein [Rhodococcus erythropolis]ALU73755.1 hypothetical protein H351_32200 [Rhodococcus erythropolis R138]